MNPYRDFRRRVLPPEPEKEPSEELKNLISFMRISHALLRWMSGTLLLVAFIFVCVFVMYFTCRGAWRMIDVINDWI